MNYQERLTESKRLEQENQVILSTPLMSEGNISPMQVGMFSARQKARWQRDAMAKMTLESTIKQLRLTDEEIAIRERSTSAKQEAERQATIVILKSKIDFIHNLGTMSHNKNGKLRPAYLRTVEGYQQEVLKLC